MTHKLLQINPVVRLNTSTGRIMKEIGEIAVASGWESYIAYSGARDGVPSHSSQLIPVGNKPDLALHAVATRLFDAHGLVSRRATRQLIRRIRQIDPDVIHIHNVHGYWLNYPLLCRYLQESGKPVVWTVHDCWLYTGHCYYYSAARCERWQTGCGHCPQKRDFPASWLFDRSARNWLDKRRAFGSLERLTIVPVSDWIRREMSRSFLKDKEFRVIHNGIDLEVFRPEAAEGISAMQEIVSLPFYPTGGGSGRELVFAGALVQTIQEYVLAAMESERVATLKERWINEKYDKRGKMKQICMAREDLAPSVTEDTLNACLDEDFSVSDADQVDEVYLQEGLNTLVSYVVAPTVPEKGSWCYKMLIEADTHTIYYFARHKITDKKGAGFLPEDLKKLASRR